MLIVIAKIYALFFTFIKGTTMSKVYNFRLNDKKIKDNRVIQFLEERKKAGYSYTDSIIKALDLLINQHIKYYLNHN